MARITAKGKYFGVDRTIEGFIKDGKPYIVADGEHDAVMQIRFNKLLKQAPALGGTYWPSVDSLLAAYSVLQSAFFDSDSPVRIRVEGDIGEIPAYDDVEGIVY